MDLEETHCRKVYRKNKSLILTIPTPLAKKLGIDSGQFMKVSEQNGILMYESLKLSNSKNHKNKASKTSKKSAEQDTSRGDTELESDGKHVVDLDDPNFNPINRLAL